MKKETITKLLDKCFIHHVENWKDSLSDAEWKALLIKHGHYHHDIGVNEDEVIQMWKDEGFPIIEHSDVMQTYTPAKTYTPEEVKSIVKDIIGNSDFITFTPEYGIKGWNALEKVLEEKIK